jgi:hypothetical protein
MLMVALIAGIPGRWQSSNAAGNAAANQWQINGKSQLGIGRVDRSCVFATTEIRGGV